MSAQILLLRGINVGGHGKLKMADLRAMLLDLGAGDVRTYIQSGNAVVARPVDADGLADQIKTTCGFRPGVIALSTSDWRASLAANPFAVADPKSTHAFFHNSDATPDMAALHAKAAGDEQLADSQGIIWLHAPNGIGRSKLVAAMEKLLGLTLTGRNGRTLAAVDALVAEFEP